MSEPIQLSGGGLKCDNPVCDWQDMSVKIESYVDCIDMPCPKCGQNVLTLEDYKNVILLFEVVNFANDNPEELSEINDGPPVLVTFNTHKELSISKVTPLKKCYISGKISGLDKEVFISNFSDAEKQIIAIGYIPVNPSVLHESCEHDKEWNHFMRCDIKHLMDCDAIFVMSNWNESKGACIEVKLAQDLGLKIYFE